MIHLGARHIGEATPNRLTDICKMVCDFYHLRIVAKQQTTIAIHALLDRRHKACRIFEGATTMCEDSMPTLHEQC
jgi:hypothetical protein